MAGIVVVQGITAAAIPTLYRATLFLIGAGSIAGYIAILVSKEKLSSKAQIGKHRSVLRILLGNEYVHAFELVPQNRPDIKEGRTGFDDGNSR